VARGDGTASGVRRPASDFDLELFTRASIAFCGKHELIAAILRGDEDPWDP